MHHSLLLYEYNFLTHITTTHNAFLVSSNVIEVIIKYLIHKVTYDVLLFITATHGAFLVSNYAI
jgi:hypothetical protein